MSAEDEELEAVFRAESAAIAADLGRALLALEREGPGADAQSEAYRHFHTLKGMAHMAGLEEVAALCHDAESALAAGREPAVDELLQVLDHVARLLRAEGADAPRAPQSALAAAATPVGASSDAAFVPVSVRRLDELVDLAGELSIAETRLRFEARTRVGGASDDAFSRVGSLTRALQESVMRARLIPVRALFARLPRLARDAAHTAGREVQVELEDANLELDRAVVDRMTGVLAHLLQNAVVHGIEAPADRERAGKPREGRIAVRARREHEMAVIEMEDDGAGVDVAAVRERAVARGMLEREAATALTDQAAAELLLEPGFTTRESADEHAGRGVGLTAVRAVVTSLGGGLDIRSERGAGTRVTLRLPPSVAVLDTLIATVRGSTVAIPLRNVRRIVAATDARAVGSATAVVHEDAPVPVLELSGEPARAVGAGFVIVARAARGLFGLAVDRVIGTHSSILKPIDVGVVGDRSSLGATVLGDGRPAIVLDPNVFDGVMQS